jgi:VanW like protein
VAVAVAIAVATAGTAAVVEASGMSERIPDGVQVDGVPVGGLSPADAARRLETHAREAAVRPIVVQGPVHTITTSGADLGAQARVSEALAASSTGRVGLIRHWLGRGESRELVLRYDVPVASVETLARRLGAAAPVDAAVTVDAAGVHVREAQNGRMVDAEALALRLSTLPRRVIVPTLASAPEIRTSEALTAASRARRLTDNPRELLIGSESHTLAPRELRALLLITRAEGGLRIEFDPVRLRRLLPPASAPRDAALAIEGERVRVVPARPGRTFDPVATAAALADPSQETVRAAVTVVPPNVSTSELTALGIREQISTFTTSYPPGQPRVVNIKRAASVIDGTILRPGATFSMNQVLGERTVAKGYVPAPQIGAGNSFVDSVGGGISQVATMLYNGAFFAGLELIEHQPHSLYIDRYPLGREATISWGGPELIFRNDWPAAVLIKLYAGPDSITVRFFSSRLERRVETETLAPFGNGGGGFTVDYTRRVYKGSMLINDERFRVRYGVSSSHGH